MKISELIAELEGYQARYGDLEAIIEQEEPFYGVSTVENLFLRQNWNKKMRMLYFWIGGLSK